MDKSTQTASSGLAADAGAAIATISTPNPESEARLFQLVAERGPAVRVRLRAPVDLDLSGHQLDATSLTVDVVGDDDTEGHTIRLHFPTPQDAKQFEQRLIATGVVVGALVIGGAGGLALSQALPDASGTQSTQAQIVQPGVFAPSTGGATTAKEQGLLNAITGDAAEASGGQVGTSSSTGDVETGKEKGLLNAITDDEGN